MSNYDRTKAVAYALKYAIDPNPAYIYFEDNDCTNFISQCLAAGGAQNNYHPTHPWWYLDGECSVSWSVAGSLYWYIRVSSVEDNDGIRAETIIQSTDEPLSNSILDIIELGDIIQYKDVSGQIRHSAIITDFEQTRYGIEPLICQHTSNSRNIPWRKSFPIAYFHHITGIN